MGFSIVHYFFVYFYLYIKKMINENMINYYRFINESKVDFDDWYFEEPTDIKEHIFNYGWVKVFKKDWSCFIDYLFSINITKWANGDFLNDYTFNDILSVKIPEQDLKILKETNYVYMKIYQGEYSSIYSINTMTYFFDKIKNKIKLDTSNHVVFEC